MRPQDCPTEMNVNRTAATEERRGSIIVLAALLMVVLLGMVAFAVDIGYITNTKAELRRAVDSGALAGAGVLVEGTTKANSEVTKFLTHPNNLVGHRSVKTDEITITPGNYVSGVFSPTNNLPSAVKVHVDFKNQPLFFGRVLGKKTVNLSAEAIAQYQPRDIMMVLDFSGSMCDDSTLGAIGTLGRTTVEASIAQIYADMGSPKYGTMKYTPVSDSSTSSSTLLKNLGLTKVAYPFPGGSWADYFTYVQTDASVNTAGYRKKYGYLTFIDYIQVNQPRYADTPILWQCAEQPVTALKDAMEVFLSYLNSVQTDDRLGLSIYDSMDDTAILESGLTHNYTYVNDICRHRQAGHYQIYTNIGAGILNAKNEIVAHGRTGAFKMIVLMTDGVANKPTNATTAKAYVITQANACAAAKIPIICIGLGAGADTALLQQVASLTKGACFIIPGGQTAAAYKDQLTAVFGQVASSRPLKLVE